MKIRVATTSPLLPMKGYAIWNVRSIDEFAEKFIKGDMLIIGEYTTSIYNFEKHNKYIATFNVIDNAFIVSADMMLALCDVDAPENRAAFHNIKLDVIDDDQNPLLNPNAH
jgi:hypothetical protein